MQDQDQKKVIFSGIQPSGTLTLGNYLGAVKNWVELQDEYDCVFSIVDLHAITVRQEPKTLRKNCIEVMALLLACGIDPEKSILFFQSHVPAHSELCWVLNCYTMYGELSRMTQFKDKSRRHSDNINAGLFDYPVLQVADILLYQADLVPVGEDQRQHIELTRNVAKRFNDIYGETFKMPEIYVPKIGAKIMSLQDPTSKMSKSDDNVNAYIALLDDPDTIMRKFKRAVTDSEASIRYADEKPGVSNLLGIMSILSGKSIAQLECEFEGKGYGPFKEAVGGVVVETLRPIRESYTRILSEKGELERIYRSSAEKAAARALRTMQKVHRKVGFVR